MSPEMELVWKITPLFFLSISRMANVRMIEMRMKNTVIMVEIMMVVMLVVMMTVWQKRRLAARRFEIVQSRSWRSPARRLYIIVNPLFIIVIPLYSFDVTDINHFVCHYDRVRGKAIQKQHLLCSFNFQRL